MRFADLWLFHQMAFKPGSAASRSVNNLNQNSKKKKKEKKKKKKKKKKTKKKKESGKKKDVQEGRE